LAQAITHLDESARLAREVDDKPQLAMSLNTLGNAYLQRRGPGDLAQAITHLDESARLAREVDDKPQLAMSLNTLGNAYLQRRGPGDLVQAITHLDEGEKIDPDPVSRAMTLNTLGKAHIWNNEPRKAVDRIQEGLSMLEGTRNLRTRAAAHAILGQAHEKLQEYELAYTNYKAAAAFNRDIGNHSLVERDERRAENMMRALRN
jgi:tetratricopeptide (TPR) repeat protein